MYAYLQAMIKQIPTLINSWYFILIILLEKLFRIRIKHFKYIGNAEIGDKESENYLSDRSPQLLGILTNQQTC